MKTMTCAKCKKAIERTKKVSEMKRKGWFTDDYGNWYCDQHAKKLMTVVVDKPS